MLEQDSFDFIFLQDNQPQRERATFFLKHKITLKEARKIYGLWDHVYDKEAIRSLENHRNWVPGRREKERRDKIKKKKDHSENGDEEKDSDEPIELSDLELSYFKMTTNFDENCIKNWHSAFYLTCPKGTVNQSQMMQLLKNVFPHGKSKEFINAIFQIYSDKMNNNKGVTLDFREFLLAMNVTTCKSEREKMEWAFKVHDKDQTGKVDAVELSKIFTILEIAEGDSNGNNAAQEDPKKGKKGAQAQQQQKPKLSVRDRTLRIFRALGRNVIKDKITMEEFVTENLKFSQKPKSSDNELIDI